MYQLLLCFEYVWDIYTPWKPIHLQKLIWRVSYGQGDNELQRHTVLCRYNVVNFL